MSNALTLWVRAPREIISTPDSATSRIFSIVTLPLASSFALPFTSFTAFAIVGQSMLSSIITFTPQSTAS